jgi:hypothetical protein
MHEVGDKMGAGYTNEIASSDLWLCDLKDGLVRYCLLALVSGVLLTAQTQPLTKTDQDVIVAFAQKAAVDALNFRQGNLASLTRAQPDFTPEGWTDFLKRMQGFLDDHGSPTFTSSFVPSGDAVVVDEKNGIVHFRIPGTLKQTHDQSNATYRVRIQVHAGGKPVKISQLEQPMCIGSSACQ